MAITDWPQDQRPRERLIKLGPSALADIELIAIFLRVGMAGKSALDLARDMVGHFGTLDRMLKSNLSEWIKIPGLGPAKYAQFIACMELARRALRENLLTPFAFSNPQAAGDYVSMKLRHQCVEQFLVIFMNNQHCLIHDEIMFEGTLAQTAVYPREIAKKAMTLNASAIIVAHNHPSGSCEPSQADLVLTEQLGKALSLLDIRLLDHLIVAGPHIISLRKRSDWPLL